MGTAEEFKDESIEKMVDSYNLKKDELDLKFESSITDIGLKTRSTLDDLGLELDKTAKKMKRLGKKTKWHQNLFG